MAKSPTDPVAPVTAYPVLDVVEHNGVRYAPDTDRPAIPAAEVTDEQLAVLIAAGVVAS